jgi:geranylgeranyl diphosphate synthase type I
VLAGASAERTDALASYGAELGIAFQLVDDLLGIWGSPDVTGKPVLSDLRARKKSLPVVYALNAGTPDSARLAELYREPAPPSEDVLHEMARLVDVAGGRDWAAAEADRRIASAEAHLAESGMADHVAAEFRDIALFVTSRDH